MPGTGLPRDPRLHEPGEIRVEKTARPFLQHSCGDTEGNQNLPVLWWEIYADKRTVLWIPGSEAEAPEDLPRLQKSREEFFRGVNKYEKTLQSVKKISVRQINKWKGDKHYD